MVIVCSTDDNFVQHCIMMLTSLVIHNRDVRIYILTEKLEEKNINLIEDEMQPYGVDLNFIQVDSNIIKSLPMPETDTLKHISYATYYRLLMGKILPENEKKVIYLDCDIIINGSIQELWETNIDKYALGAVIQIGDNEDCQRLGISEEKGYFNAGVLLINLDYWRSHKTEERLLEYIARHREKIKFHDQDVLNAVLHNEFLQLPPKWNLSSLHFNPFVYKYIKKDKTIPYAKKKQLLTEIKDLKKNPVIVHYLYVPKPWEKWCFSIHQKLYYDTAALTKHYRHLKYNKAANKLAFFKYNIVVTKNELLRMLHLSD